MVVDGHGIPLGSILTSASPAEVTSAKKTVEAVKVLRKGRRHPIKRPLRLIADKAYDSDPLRKRLKVFKIDLIVPHRNNHKKVKTQDGRKVRRYRKRWKVGVSSKGHIIQSVKVRPGTKGSIPVAWEAPWRESKMVKPSDRLFRKEMMQGFRPQRTVNADVASLHATSVAETVDNVRRQQGSFETSPIRRFSPTGYQRWHVAKDYVSTGEALGVRRRNLVEEAVLITLNGKWERRHQGGGLGCSTVDRCAAKRTSRKGPRPVVVPFVDREAGAR